MHFGSKPIQCKYNRQKNKKTDRVKQHFKTNIGYGFNPLEKDRSAFSVDIGNNISRTFP